LVRPDATQLGQAFILDELADRERVNVDHFGDLLARHDLANGLGPCLGELGAHGLADELAQFVGRENGDFHSPSFPFARADLPAVGIQCSPGTMSAAGVFAIFSTRRFCVIAR
jgi:hypothetical protein